MLPNRFTEPDFPQQASDVKWRKTTEEGEKRKGDRIGDEGSGRGTGKTMNTKGNNEPSNQVFHKTTTSCFVYNRLSYREKEKDVRATRRFAEIVFANGS